LCVTDLNYNFDVGYEFLDHTGDAMFRARGGTLEEAIRSAALAVASLIWDGMPAGEPESRKVLVEGRSLEQLVVRTLDEIVYLVETEGFLLSDVEGIRLGGPDGRLSLEAAFVGERITDRHELRGGVKAVTYNQLTIERDDGVTIQVVVDV